ncbi:MAG: YIP1 family protein [Pseudohongiellaceae bacterium]
MTELHTTAYSSYSSSLLFRSLYEPNAAFTALSQANPSPWAVLLRHSLWLLLLPPLFALIGAANFGWRLGAAEPLRLPLNELFLISVGYFALLVFGLLSTALISCWMAATYGANQSPGRNLALITIVGEPLALASAAHLYPDVFVNILVLIPAMMWSMYLLYKGVPTALDTPPERGMLMASSLVGWLLVAAVSLLGLSMGLWVIGIGPLLGV